MLRFIASRLAQSLLSLLAVTIFIFSVVRMTGDPLQVLLPPEAPPQQYTQMRQLLHLDEPLPAQYVRWLLHMMVGDFGVSTRLQRPVTKLVVDRLPATLELALAGFSVTLLLGLSIGVYAAAYRGSALDAIARGFAVIGQAAPNFWLGTVLILVFAVKLHWLPAGGYGKWESFILPAITLGWYPVAGVMRLTRSSMIEVLGTEYVKLARVKGVSERRVLWRHAFRNAALPVLTFGALVLIFMISGNVIVETVFAWPGVGQMVLEAVTNRDFPIVQAIVLMFSCFFIATNLLVDIAYAYLNPRIKY